MATLAEQIQTELGILIADKTMIDLSRQRDASDDENTVRTAKVASHAAALVESFLGDGITDADVVAVDAGTRLAFIRYATVYTGKLTDVGVQYTGEVRRELQRIADSRRASESTPQVADQDFTDLDTRFPGTTWET